MLRKKARDDLSPRVSRSRKADKAELERWMAKAADRGAATDVSTVTQTTPPPPQQPEPHGLLKAELQRKEEQLRAANAANSELREQLADLNKQQLSAREQGAEIQRLSSALAAAELKMSAMSSRGALEALETELAETRLQLRSKAEALEHANSQLSQSRETCATLEEALAGSEARIRQINSTAAPREKSLSESKWMASPKSPSSPNRGRNIKDDHEDGWINKMLVRAELIDLG